MHISILLMEQIIELFIMIFMGFIIVKDRKSTRLNSSHAT